MLVGRCSWELSSHELLRRIKKSQGPRRAAFKVSSLSGSIRFGGDGDHTRRRPCNRRSTVHNPPRTVNLRIAQWSLYISITSLRSASRLVGRV
jgi:hypothetical protein